MSEVELDNKLRLNQVRRDAAKKRLNNSNESKGSASTEQKSKTAVSLAVAQKAKNIITAPTKIQAMDVPIYGLAISLALLKDFLDIAIIGSLPAIGTVITLCVSMAIGFILLFDGVSFSQRKVVRKMTKRYLVLIAGTLAEGILFGLNFLPLETLIVIIIYWMSLADRKATFKLNQQNQEEN